jgi:nucleotide-binding universal stress UspA family protein
MYDRILFPTDGSETASAVLAYAGTIAAEHGAELHVLTVADTTRDSVTQIGGEVVDALEQAGEQTVADAADQVAGYGVDVETAVHQGEPYATIVDYTTRYGMDLVVMPTHGRAGLERFLLGSVTERVVNRSPVPVLTVNPDLEAEPVYPAGDILVPTDGSPGAEQAVAEGAAIAAATGAALHLLYVVETASLGFDVRSTVADERLAEEGEALVSDAAQVAADRGVESVTTAVAYGRPYREILSYVDETAVDLIAVGRQGQTDFSRYLQGGVTTKLIRTAPTPVLLVPDEGDEN